MKLKILAIVSAGLLIAGSAFAAEFITSQNGNISTDSGQTHRNLYTAGQDIKINSPTGGDLMVAGRNIDISGNVEGSAFAAGSKITITGNVGNSFRAAGENIEVRGAVGGDVLAAGANITIDSAVTGDVLVASRNLTFGPNARVSGRVSYYGSNDPVVSEGAQVGVIDHNRPKAHDFRSATRALHAIGSIVSLLAWLVAALLLVWLFRRKATTVIHLMSRNVWRNIGLGLLGLIITPIAVVLLFFTLIGYYVAFIVLFVWLTLLAIAALLGAIWIGSLLVGWYKKSGSLSVGFIEAIIGVLVWKLIGFIPVIGWLFAIVLFLVALGATIRAGYARMKA